MTRSPGSSTSMLCLCGSACAFIGSVLLFLAAAFPPLSNMDPQAYSAFAAIAGIMAAIAGIVYCFESSGYAVKEHYDDKKHWAMLTPKEH